METEWRQMTFLIIQTCRLAYGRMYLRHSHRLLLSACHPRIDVRAICSSSSGYITSELKTPHRSDWQARRDIMPDLPGASTTGTSVSSTIHVLSCRSISGPWGCTCTYLVWYQVHVTTDRPTVA